MMNANRSLTLPESIYDDQRDSLSLLDCRWIQVYVENAQESLDMVLRSYVIAENGSVLTPVMQNLDGFALMHTYETVEFPTSEQADAFLPPFKTPYKLDLDNPKNMAFSTGPADNMEFKHQQHKAVPDAIKAISEMDDSIYSHFGRRYGGITETYRCDDVEMVMVTLGSITETRRVVVDVLREEGWKAGLLKIRFMRQFPEKEIMDLSAHDIDYAATASVGYIHDLLHKENKAKSVDGTSYIHIFTPCPTGWGTPPDIAIDIGNEVVDCDLWYLVEWENDKFILNRNSKDFASVMDYLSQQGRFKHLKDEDVEQIIQERNGKWAMIRKSWSSDSLWYFSSTYCRPFSGSIL